MEIFWTFVEILFRFNVISIRKRQVFFYIKYIKYGVIIFEPVVNRRARKTNEYIFAVSSARGQLSAWLHQSLFRRRANVLLVENLATRRVSTPKSFDRFSPIRENLFSNIRISLSKHGTILKSERLIGRNSKSFFGGGSSGVQFLPYLRSSLSRDCSSERVSPRFLQSGRIKTSTKGHLVHKGNSKDWLLLFFLSLSLSHSLPPFFPPNVEKSILELSFRFVSFRGCSAAVSPRLFRSSRAFVPALLRFPDRFSSIVGNYGTHCPVSLFSREHGENGGTMYRADKRKWAEKGRRPRRGMISAVRFFVCFENRDSFLPDRGKRRIVCNFVSSNITRSRL